MTVSGAFPDVGEPVATAVGGEFVPPEPVYVAVYVVAVAGAVMLCAAAPPSDQDENVYVVPPCV